MLVVAYYNLLSVNFAFYVNHDVNVTINKVIEPFKYVRVIYEANNKSNSGL